MGKQKYKKREDKALEGQVIDEFEREREGDQGGFQKIWDDLRGKVDLDSSDSPYDQQDDDPSVFEIDASGGAVQLNLLNPADVEEGALAWIKALDVSNDITISVQDGDGDGNIEGSDSYVISASAGNLEGLILKANDNDWNIYARFAG